MFRMAFSLPPGRALRHALDQGHGRKK